MMDAPDDEVWVTKDGRRLKVGEMSEDHVRGVLRMLIRNRRRRAQLRRDLAALRDWIDEIDSDDAKWGKS